MLLHFHLIYIVFNEKSVVVTLIFVPLYVTCLFSLVVSSFSLFHWILSNFIIMCLSTGFLRFLVVDFSPHYGSHLFAPLHDW